MKIEYDRTACSAWFQCVQEWDAFEMNMMAGKADLEGAEEVKDDLFVLKIPADVEKKAKAATETCPVDAIRLLDDDDEQILP